MKLLRLTLENFRGAPNGTHLFTRTDDGPPVDTVYITGAEASGKTSFLEAIVALKESVGAYGAPPNPARLLRSGKSTGRVEGIWQLSPEEMDRVKTTQRTWTTKLDLGNLTPEPADPTIRQLFEAYDHDPAHGKFEYFPSNRRLEGRDARTSTVLDVEARLRPGTERDKYTSVKRFLIDLALSDGVKAIEESMARGVLFRAEQRDSLAPYRRDLASVSPSIRLSGVETNRGLPDLAFERADGTRLFVDDLSDSEKQAVLFCVTFRRIGLSRSIVLVDQPELHQHPDAHVRIVQAITQLGENNQIFFATSSPEVTRTAAPHQIVRLGTKG
ncbi:hypothetical protein [Sorangium sp. So ce131]|uniref:hypothetical protein n=1 Tax=Sorangium sp. So ce131 TaxID=3133282 RepID=UPI003F5E98CA